MLQHKRRLEWNGRAKAVRQEDLEDLHHGLGRRLEARLPQSHDAPVESAIFVPRQDHERVVHKLKT